MPVFVVPPLASLIFAILSMRQKENTAVSIQSDWLAIISLLNIVLSLLLLYRLHFSPHEVVAFVRDLVNWALGSILHVIPGGHKVPGVIPI